MKKMIFSIMLLALSGPALSAGVEDAKVTKVGTYGNGRVLIGLDKEIPEGGCKQNRFDIEGTHEEKQTVVSIALAALMSGKTVKIKTNGCIDAAPKFSTSEGSIFYVND